MQRSTKNNKQHASLCGWTTTYVGEEGQIKLHIPCTTERGRVRGSYKYMYVLFFRDEFVNTPTGKNLMNSSRWKLGMAGEFAHTAVIARIS